MISAAGSYGPAADLFSVVASKVAAAHSYLYRNAPYNHWKAACEVAGRSIWEISANMGFYNISNDVSKTSNKEE